MMDGWLLTATRSPGPFSPGHKPAPKDRQSDKRAWGASGPHARFVLGSSISQNIPKAPTVQEGKPTQRLLQLSFYH